MFSIIQSAFYCEAVPYEILVVSSCKILTHFLAQPFLRIVYVAGLLTTWCKSMRFLKFQSPHLQHKPTACAASA